MTIYEDAYKIQIDYMTETRDPSNLSVKVWILRMKAINDYLPAFGLRDVEATFLEERLVCITNQKISHSWRSMLKLAGGHRSATVAAASKTLTYI